MTKLIMKCCICNNKNTGEFITINEKKYHLCCIEKQNQKYKEVINKAKEWVEKKINSCTIEANSTTTDTMCRITIVGLNHILDILKEVK